MKSKNSHASKLTVALGPLSRTRRIPASMDLYLRAHTRVKGEQPSGKGIEFPSLGSEGSSGGLRNNH